MTQLTLLPGLACDADLWADLLPDLQALLPVQVSDVQRRFATLPQMAAALLDEHPGELVLCGASMGGMLALEAQRQAPQRIRAMALLGSSARADTPELIELRTRACEWFAQGRMDEVLQANLGFAFHGPSVERRPQLVPRYLAMMARAGAAQLIAQNCAVMARVDSLPLLPAVQCPVLLMCGLQDRLAPPECTQEMAERLPRAQLQWLDDCGHMLTLEQPDRVSAALSRWLRQLGLHGQVL